MRDQRGGLAFGAAAYLCWGFFPLYWPLLEPAGPIEVLSHRVVWSLVFVLGLLTATRGWRRIAVVLRSPRLVALLGVAAVAIAVNWGMFIYGVTSGHVIETSLGYFINPLVTVMLGVVVLGERLRVAQWTAAALGAAAVIVLTVAVGRPPWIAFVLALSFSTYGFCKKKAGLGTVEGLGVETLILTPLALAYLLTLQSQGDLVFGHDGWPNAVLLALTGVVTAIPLLLFGAAATRLSLTTIGLMQYFTPVVQFVLGLVVFHEQMNGFRWAGFALVWLALVVFTTDAVRSHRRPAPVPVA